MMMREPEIAERLKRVIMEKLEKVTNAMITPKAHFICDLGADSLDQIDLVMGIEDEFDIEIPDEDAGEIETFGDAEQYIKEHLALKSLGWT